MTGQTVEHVVQGAGAPSAVPPSLGAHYIDTATGKQYLAKGTASVDDWVLQATGMTKAEADETYQPKGSYATSQQLASKVDAAEGMGLSSNDFTAGEKQKLAALEGSHYRGTFVNLAALQSAVPAGVAGDYADVDAGVDSAVARYLWDSSDNAWTAQHAPAEAMTAAQVKDLYEANPDTNAFTDQEKSKLQALTPGESGGGGDGGSGALRTFQRSSAAGMTVLRSTDVALYLEGVAAIPGSDWVEVPLQLPDLVDGQLFEIEIVSMEGNDTAIPFVVINPPAGAIFSGMMATGAMVNAGVFEGQFFWDIAIRQRANLRILAAQAGEEIKYLAELDVIELPPPFGTPMEGGYLAGVHEIDGVSYQLILAPKEYETFGIQWKTTNSSTSGAWSETDGAANTAVLEASGVHPAGQYCGELVAGGQDDWYLPSSGEMFLIVDNLNPGKDLYLPAEFRSGGAQALVPDGIYWTSQSINISDVYVNQVKEGYPSQSGADPTSETYYTRPVRKVPIT